MQETEIRSRRAADFHNPSHSDPIGGRDEPSFGRQITAPPPLFRAQGSGSARASSCRKSHARQDREDKATAGGGGTHDDWRRGYAEAQSVADTYVAETGALSIILTTQKETVRRTGDGPLLEWEEEANDSARKARHGPHCGGRGRSSPARAAWFQGRVKDRRL